MSQSVMTEAIEAAGVAMAEHFVKAKGTKKSSQSEASKEIFDAALPVAMSMITDPNSWGGSNADTAYRASPLTWADLRSMSLSPIPRSVITLRANQVARYARPQESRYVPGFQIALRESNRPPRPHERKMASDITRFMEQCGTIQDVRQHQTRIGFVDFTRLVMDDALSFDQACAEIVPTKGSRFGVHTPARMIPVDATTIEFARPPENGKQLKDTDFNAIRTVQVIDGQVVNEYTASRMMMGIRNRSTNIKKNGYGVSELEWMLKILTAWINAFEHNFRAFTQGLSSHSLINIQGSDASQELINSFKYDLQMMASGIQGSHRVPVMNAENLQVVPLNTATDAQWTAWNDILTKLICALYKVDPAEINFTYGNTGQSGAMGNASVEEKILMSQLRGLVPLVEAYFDWLNRWVIWPLCPDFVIKPTGLRGRDEKEDLELDRTRVTNIYTLNEVRATHDLPPVSGGDLPLNPVALQASQLAAGEEEPEADDLDIGDLFDENPDPGGMESSEQDDSTQDFDVLQASRRTVRRRLFLDL